LDEIPALVNIDSTKSLVSFILTDRLNNGVEVRLVQQGQD
jgi:hypothetical protein